MRVTTKLMFSHTLGTILPLYPYHDISQKPLNTDQILELWYRYIAEVNINQVNNVN
jgi:hypothetical protein